MTTDRIKTKHPGIYERGSRYCVWYNCSGCKPDGSCPGHTETLPAGSLLRDAVARRAELVSKVANGGLLVGRKMRLGDYANSWLETQEGKLAPKTIETYAWGIKTWIVPNLGQRYVHELSIDDVSRLVTKMKREGKKAWTIRAALTPLSRMMNHAVRGGLAQTNPVKGLDKSERPKGDQRKMVILSSDEIARLLSSVPLEEGDALFLGQSATPKKSTPSVSGKPPLSENWRPLISFLVFTGLRIGESLAAKWEDVDLDQGIVVVTSSKTAAGTGRSVILISGLQSILRRHRLRSAYSAPEDYVFPGLKGQMLNRHYVLEKVLKPAIKTAGVTPVTLHELRHTFASILIGQGFDRTFVADQLGHANPNITESLYGHLFDPEARKTEARDKLQIAFGGLL